MGPVLILTIGLTLSFYMCFVMPDDMLIQLCEPNFMYNFIHICYNFSEQTLRKEYGWMRSLENDQGAIQRLLDDKNLPELDSEYWQRQFANEHNQFEQRAADSEEFNSDTDGDIAWSDFPAEGSFDERLRRVPDPPQASNDDDHFQEADMKPVQRRHSNGGNRELESDYRQQPFYNGDNQHGQTASGFNDHDSKIEGGNWMRPALPESLDHVALSKRDVLLSDRCCDSGCSIRELAIVCEP
ncbi:uncharacterized protein [Scyliorhinus torazame]|uniref:uncharacterized protein n=1 Tax=Scyliorhinus torazame TaxID=75743 RepID=UPI003B59984D